MAEVTIAVTLDDAPAAALFRAADEAGTSASCLAAFLILRGLNRQAGRHLRPAGILVSYAPCGCLAAADLTAPTNPDSAARFRREELALGRTIVEVPASAQVTPVPCRAHDHSRSAA